MFRFKNAFDRLIYHAQTFFHFDSLKLTTTIPYTSSRSITAEKGMHFPLPDIDDILTEQKLSDTTSFQFVVVRVVFLSQKTIT
jgi:hypothetical protein